jgi:hypothetical protein
MAGFAKTLLIYETLIDVRKPILKNAELRGKTKVVYTKQEPV